MTGNLPVILTIAPAAAEARALEIPKHIITKPIFFMP